jgi:hypothetical protein
MAVFEINHGTHHDHIVCMDCGAVEEFVDAAIETRQSRLPSDSGFASKSIRWCCTGAASARLPGPQTPGRQRLGARLGGAARGGRRRPQSRGRLAADAPRVSISSACARARGGDLHAAEHAREFLDPRLALEPCDAGARAAPVVVLGYPQVLVPCAATCGRCVTHSTCARCQRPQLAADDLGHRAADAGVDLIEDHARGACWLQVTCTASDRRASSPPGGDLGHRARRRAGIGADLKLDLIDAVRGWFGAVGCRHLDKKAAATHAKFLDAGLHCLAETTGRVLRCADSCRASSW